MNEPIKVPKGISTIADNTETKAPKITKTPVSPIQKIELGILSLVLLSNGYFGYALMANGSTAVSSTAVAAEQSSGSTQLQPAAIPKMVGGC